MVKKLKTKFVLTATLSLLVILIGIIGFINVANYIQVQTGADDVLTILAENDGMFPEMKNKLPKPDGNNQVDDMALQGGPGGNDHLPIAPFSDDRMAYNRTLELPFQSRYFWVRLSENGKAKEINTGHIAAISSGEAASYAEEIYKNKEENKSLKNKNINKIFVNHKKTNIDKNKKCEDNNNNNNNNNCIISHSQNTKKIKINTIINSKNDRNNNEKKRNRLSKETIKKNNYIENFKVEECDENIEQNKTDLIKNSSLTNQNILPCIPFSNPFTSKNKNKNSNNKKENNESIKENKNKKIKKEILENNIINDYIENKDEDEDEDEEDVKLNISNLDVDIEQMNDEVIEENNSKNEIQIRNINKNYKSFIQFNNNLSIKLAAEKSKNTPSYLLALCPKLYMGFNKKNKIIDNYAVNDAISEEMESDTLTPKNSKTKNSFEDKNTKYSTKEKNSDRNKKQKEIESEEGSYEEDKKNIYNNSNPERKNKNNIYNKS